MTDEQPALTRAQNRLLRRIFNGRANPLVVDGKAFLTCREAVRHLLALPTEEREIAYGAMKAQAKLARLPDGAGG